MSKKRKNKKNFKEADKAWDRIVLFFSNEYDRYKEKYEHTPSSHYWKRICIFCAFIHIIISSFEKVLLGLVSFSLAKLDEKTFLQRYSKEDRIVAKRVIADLRQMEQEKIQEKQEMEKPVLHAIQFYDNFFVVYSDIAKVIGFLLSGGIPALMLAVRLGCKVHRQRKIKKQEPKYNMN